MKLQNKKHSFYIFSITVITFLSVIFAVYLYSIYFTQKKSIEAQAFSLSVAKELNRLIFDTRRVMSTGSDEDMAAFIESLNKTKKYITVNSYHSDESIKEYIQFKETFLTDLETLISLRKRNRTLHRTMVAKAVSSYDSSLKLAHDISSFSQDYSLGLTKLVKELTIDIAEARQLDRDFQLVISIEKKRLLIRELFRSFQKVKLKLFTIQNILVGTTYTDQLENIKSNTESYRDLFNEFSRIHISVIEKQRKLDTQLERIDSLIDNNSVKQYEYLNQYNNATKSFLVGLIIFLTGIVIFIVFIYNAYNTSNKNEDRERLKNLEKSKFLARMSHEIRTPLNGIIGTISMMKQQEPCDSCDQRESYIEALSSSSISLKNHIDNILDISKIESGVMEVNQDRFSLAQVFEQIENIANPLITNNQCDLKFFGDRDVDVFLDKTKFRQIMLNYVSNAIKYSDPNKKKRYVNVNYKIFQVSPSRALIRVDIEDNGIGMSAKELANFSKPYKQFGQWQESSSGLGANVAREYIKLMDGTFKIKSQAGVGTTISVYLKSKIASSSYQVGKQQILSLNNSLRVLVVEDNIFNRQIIGQQLKYLGCHVDSAEDGMAAKQLLEKNNFYDLVITDIKMPNMDGVSLTDFIRNELNSQLPIIALTADALKQDHHLFKEVGINKVLTKPVLLEDLNTTLLQFSDKDGLTLAAN